MIPWYWILISFIIGSCCGAVLMGVCCANRENDEG